MIEACYREVVDLHAFFEAWFSGRVRRSETSFARVAHALAEDFRYIDRAGGLRGQRDVLASISDQHGQHPGFGIEIRNFDPRFESQPYAVVVYEEHQTLDDVPNARVSTAVFRRSNRAPEGVEWVHLHETTLP